VLGNKRATIDPIDFASDMSQNTDNLSPEQRRYTMTQVHSKDTGPELTVRRLLHSLGYRYRLHRKDLPGNPDLVFVSRRRVIFVHGCFWHGHDCRSGRKRPKTNEEYWLKKLERNRARDAENQAKLLALGWKVLIVWECQISEIEQLTISIRQFLD
jgi:DNA mismatch endonuclease (patch repair protein)